MVIHTNNGKKKSQFKSPEIDESVRFDVYRLFIVSVTFTTLIQGIDNNFPFSRKVDLNIESFGTVQFVY